MSEFKDSEGRKWRINLTLGGVKKDMDDAVVVSASLKNYGAVTFG